MKYRTAIRPWSNRRLEKMDKVDIVIGIATHNNQDTIEDLIDMVSEGIQKYYRNMKTLIIVADGGSTDDTRDVANSKTVYPYIEKMVTIYRGNPGKSSAYRMIFESARFLNARVCVICDPAAQNVKPEWIKNLIDPILIADYHFAISSNNHHKHDAFLSNNFAYFLIRAFFGRQIRQPLGGDYGVSGNLASFFIEQEIWENQTSAYGIDLWMTLTATMEGFKVCQSNLGYKKVEHGNQFTFLEENFIEVITSIFEMMEKYKGALSQINGSSPVTCYNEPLNELVENTGVDGDECVRLFQEGFQHFSPLWQHVLKKENFEDLEKVSQLPKGPFSFPTDLWARIIYDISQSYIGWNSTGKKLIQCLSPIYFGFLADFIFRTAELNDTEVEEEVLKDAEVFEEMKKSYFMKETVETSS